MIGTTSRGTGAIGQCCIRSIKFFFLDVTSSPILTYGIAGAPTKFDIHPSTYMIHTTSKSFAPNHSLVTHSTLPMHLSSFLPSSTHPPSSTIHPPTSLLLFQTFHYQETAVDEAIPPIMSGSRWLLPLLPWTYLLTIGQTVLWILLLLL